MKKSDKQLKAEVIGDMFVKKMKNRAKEKVSPVTDKVKRVSDLNKHINDLVEKRKQNPDAYRYLNEHDEPEKVSNVILDTVRTSRKSFEMETEDGHHVDVSYGKEIIDAKKDDAKEQKKQRSNTEHFKGTKYLAKRGVLAMIGYMKTMTYEQNTTLQGRAPR